MLVVDEIFESIQGETSLSGIPTTFIRLFGCNVGCVYCDQPQSTFTNMTEEEIVERVVSLSHNNVCITGGEPLNQDIAKLLYDLLEYGYEVSVETSGCVVIPPSLFPLLGRVKFVVDIKCPSSGVSFKNAFTNLSKLTPHDEVKFVIANREDYDYMKTVIGSVYIRAEVLVSPMFDKNMKAVIGKDLVDWILKDKLNIRVQIQLHKILGVL